MPIGAEVVKKRDRVAFLEWQIADCEFVGLQIGILDAWMYYCQDFRVWLSDPKFVEVIAVEIEETISAEVVAVSDATAWS